MMNSRTSSWVDRLLSVATLAMLAAGAFLFWENRIQPAQELRRREPSLVTEAAGQPLTVAVVRDSTRRVDTLPTVGPARVLYVFNTSCKFCAAQQEHIAELLASVDAASVMTASPEPATATALYWRNTAHPLAQPLVLADGALRDLGLDGVPALVFLSPAGRVTSAYVGTVFPWDQNRLSEELRRAAQPGS